MYKKNNQNKKKKDPVIIILSVVLTLFCIGFLFSGVRVLTILNANRKANAEYNVLRETAKEQASPAVSAVLPTVASQTEEAVTASPAPVRAFSVDVAGLQANYPDMKGWIVLDGTQIDYPIVQAKDNDYYLYRLYDGTQNANGSIFMDCRNTGIFLDDNTVIYGHNMQSGIMFAVLNRYKSQAFFEEHPTMVISTADGDYLAELICGTVEDGNRSFMQFQFNDFEDMEEYVNQHRKRSTFQSEVRLQPGDKLLTLCTCTYELFNGRFMLIAKVSELYEQS